MKTVADYLRNAPKGTKLYSPIFGECSFDLLTHTDNIIVRYNGKLAIFDKLGIYTPNNEKNTEGECLLFPSKEVRDWSNYQLPHDFKPFDKVVVRDEGLWYINFFERCLPDEKSPYECLHGVWKHCLPFNEETAKLIGTKDEYNG